MSNRYVKAFFASQGDSVENQVKAYLSRHSELEIVNIATTSNFGMVYLFVLFEKKEVNHGE